MLKMLLENVQLWSGWGHYISLQFYQLDAKEQLVYDVFWGLEI